MSSRRAASSLRPSRRLGPHVVAIASAGRGPARARRRKSWAPVCRAAGKGFLLVSFLPARLEGGARPAPSESSPVVGWRSGSDLATSGGRSPSAEYVDPYVPPAGDQSWLLPRHARIGGASDIRHSPPIRDHSRPGMKQTVRQCAAVLPRRSLSWQGPVARAAAEDDALKRLTQVARIRPVGRGREVGTPPLRQTERKIRVVPRGTRVRVGHQNQWIRGSDRRAEKGTT